MRMNAETTSTDWAAEAAAAMLEARGHDANSALLEVIYRLQGRSGSDRDWREVSGYQVAKLLRLLITGDEAGGQF